jgi:N-acyl homoserine lactone hydrolase
VSADRRTARPWLLLERSEELRRIDEVLERSRGGAGSILLIEGAPPRCEAIAVRRQSPHAGNGAARRPTMTEPHVHVVCTGRLVGNETFLRGEGFGSLLRRPRDLEFPAHSFILEQSDGLVAIDTGLCARVRSPRPRFQRRFVPNPLVEQEIGPAMRARGLDPAEVRTVVLTHLDWDHAGGLAHFPNAEVLIHRPEWEFAATLRGRLRYEPRLWPAGFKPTVYDFDAETYGPFPRSKAIGADGGVRIVPIPGHSIGQVGVIVRVGESRLFFCADHVLRADWFVEDYAANRLVGLGPWFARQAVETSRRIHAFVEDVPTVLVPSHDAGGPARLQALAPVAP